MNKPLVLVGGGGHCKSVIEAAESAGYSILGVLDMPEEVGKAILSTKVIGTDDDIPAYVDKAEFVITVGFIKNPVIRIKLYNKVKEAGGKLATVIASTAHVSRQAVLGGYFYPSQCYGQCSSNDWQQCYSQYVIGYRTRCRCGRTFPYFNRSNHQW